MPHVKSVGCVRYILPKRNAKTGHIQQVLQKTDADLPGIAAFDHTWTPHYEGDKITEIHDSDGRTARYGYDPQDFSPRWQPTVTRSTTTTMAHIA